VNRRLTEKDNGPDPLLSPRVLPTLMGRYSTRASGWEALVWALRVLYGHCMNGGRISALVIMLLLSDLLELVLNPYLVTKLLLDEPCWDSSWTCRIVTSLWRMRGYFSTSPNIPNPI
ncbi:hypothetical protein NFI96_030470, partial [Prochilodus magdalenae]